MMERRRLLAFGPALLAAAGLFSLASPAEAQLAIYLNAPPPPPPHYARPMPPPRNGYVWAPGHYRSDGRRPVWTEGNWMRERRGHRYSEPRWEQDGERWRYQRGTWQRG